MSGISMFYKSFVFVLILSIICQKIFAAEEGDFCETNAECEGIECFSGSATCDCKDKTLLLICNDQKTCMCPNGDTENAAEPEAVAEPEGN